MCQLLMSCFVLLISRSHRPNHTSSSFVPDLTSSDDRSFPHFEMMTHKSLKTWEKTKRGTSDLTAPEMKGRRNISILFPRSRKLACSEKWESSSGWCMHLTLTPFREIEQFVNTQVHMALTGIGFEPEKIIRNKSC